MNSGRPPLDIRGHGRALSTALLTRSETQQIDFHDDKGAVRAVRIPTSALRRLLEMLTEIGQGNAVSIIPIHAELTTQEAADVLNVSRPFLVLYRTPQSAGGIGGRGARAATRCHLACDKSTPDQA